MKFPRGTAAGAVVILLGLQAGGRATAVLPEIIWSVSGEGRGTPAMDASTVYFLSKRHEVVAIDAHRGEVRWRRPTSGPGDSTAGAKLVIAGGLVIAADDTLVAFDRETGERRWELAPSDGHALGLYLGASAGELVYAGSPAGRLYAIDGRLGAVRWSVPVATGRATVYAPIVSGALVVAGFTVFDTASGGVVALDVATGAERWRAALPDPGTFGSRTGRGSVGGVIAAGGLVLAADWRGVIHAFDRERGLLQWWLPPPDVATSEAVAPDFRPLAISGRLVVAGSLSGRVTAYDVETRRERWRHTPIEASVAFGLAADAGTVYVPYLSGQLVALDAMHGRERWRIGSSAQGFSWVPLPAGPRVYANASARGFLALQS